MGSCSHRGGEAPAFEENTILPTPLFSKVVLAKALQSGKLEIPKMAVMENDIGNRMANTVVLKVPNGEVWPVKLTKRREGKIYLQKGWPEFAKFYSISDRYILLFSYEGDRSSFQVRIMHTNASEIDYPLISSPAKQPNRDGTGVMPTADREFSSASSFISEHPFFVINLKGSYLKFYHLQIPTSFGRNYICKTGRTRDVNLHISDERTWSLKCCVKTYGLARKDFARFHDGWKEFVRKNDLKIGDGCVFEMIDRDGPKVTFKLYII